MQSWSMMTSRSRPLAPFDAPSLAAEAALFGQSDPHGGVWRLSRL